MESRSHTKLKQLALAFLREHGCRVAALEVRCPISRYRVDAAGYVDTAPPRDRGGVDPVGEAPLAPPPRGPSRRREPRTVLIECKRSRADFLRDREDRDRLLERRAHLERFRSILEERRIKTAEPELRRTGTSLFPELEEWDFAGSRLPAYHDLLRRLRRTDEMLHGQTKFCMIARYALADRLYLAAPEGMIKGREIPPGWGLLECSRKALREDDPNADLFGESVLRVVVRSECFSPKPRFRERLLMNIAVAACNVVSRGAGVR